MTVVKRDSATRHDLVALSFATCKVSRCVATRLVSSSKPRCDVSKTSLARSSGSRHPGADGGGGGGGTDDCRNMLFDMTSRKVAMILAKKKQKDLLKEAVIDLCAEQKWKQTPKPKIRSC